MWFLRISIALTLTGCFVRTGPPTRTVYREQRVSCPPAHHWDGNACVHNGRHRGHD